MDCVKVSVWKGEEEVPVTFLQPDNGHFDVGCIYGRGDDHVRFEFFSKCALEYMTHAGGGRILCRARLVDVALRLCAKEPAAPGRRHMSDDP